MSYKIERVEKDDEGELSIFLKSLTSRDREFFSFLDATPFEAFLDKSRFFAALCVKEVGGRIVGYGHLERFSQEHKSHIGRLGIALHPSFRGKGLSRRVMNELIKQGSLHFLSKIWLSVHLSNVKAVRLYERCGFKTEGVFFGEELRGDKKSDIVSMALYLSGERKVLAPIPWNQPAIQSEEIISVLKVLGSGWLSQGPVTAAFEKELAQYTGAKYAVAMNNGTSCLMAMFALSFKPGDRVIFPAFTFVSTLNSALTFGIEPILVDIDATTGNISLDQVEEILKHNRSVRGIVVVDIAGHPVDLDRCEKISSRYGVTIIEDAAEAIGAACYGRRVGAFNHLAMFSFHTAKLLTTIEGGAVTTNDAAMAEKLRKFRSHGEQLDKKFVWDEYGLNFRLTDLQSAIGLAQLQKLDGFIRRRNEIANLYRSKLNERVAFQGVERYVDVHPYMMCIMLVEEKKVRSEIITELKEKDIFCREGWQPLHKQPVFAKRFCNESYPVSEDFGERSLCLPIYNTMTLEEAGRVVAAVTDAIESRFQMSL